LREGRSKEEEEGPRAFARKRGEDLRKEAEGSQGDEGRELKEEEGRAESSKRAVILKEKREAVGLYGLRASSKLF
jgi:hypothetical protein